MDRDPAAGHFIFKLLITLSLVCGIGVASTECAHAQTVCSLKFRFSNHLQTPVSARYKMGVLLDRSFVQHTFSDPSILSSAKAIWSHGLKHGDTTIRTINLRFDVNCDVPRQFELYVCWLRSGQAGHPTCETLSPVRTAEPKTWTIHLELIAEPTASSPAVRVAKKGTLIKPCPDLLQDVD